jgi:transposase-like protein
MHNCYLEDEAMSEYRRRPPAAEKLRIALAGMDPGLEVAELCRREGIKPTMLCGWTKPALSSARKIVDGKSGPPLGALWAIAPSRAVTVTLY